jgi:hypothetical protein
MKGSKRGKIGTEYWEFPWKIIPVGNISSQCEIKKNLYLGTISKRGI